MVKIIKGKEAIYDVEDYDVVLMGISTHNTLMGSFQGKMNVKYPIIEKVINKTPYGDLRKLGKRITIDETKPIICLMYICTYPSRKDNFIDYDALEKCLKALKIMWNKNVNIVYIKIFKYFEKYSEYYTGYSSKDKLTKEEFDLLKEVLENDR